MQAEADRPQPRRDLRLHHPRRRIELRGIAVHAAVPRRPAHGRRRQLPHRSPGRLRGRGDAEERPRDTDRLRRLQPQRRLQPRADDRGQGAGAGHAGGARGDRPGSAQPARSLLRAPQPGGRRRHRDGRPVADLGRDRLERLDPRAHRAAHPPGEELRGRPPLRGRDAQAPRRHRDQARRARGLPLSARRAAGEGAGGRRAAQTLRQGVPRPSPGEDQAPQPLSRLGLHRL